MRTGDAFGWASSLDPIVMVMRDMGSIDVLTMRKAVVS